MEGKIELGQNVIQDSIGNLIWITDSFGVYFNDGSMLFGTLLEIDASDNAFTVRSTVTNAQRRIELDEVKLILKSTDLPNEEEEIEGDQTEESQDKRSFANRLGEFVATVLILSGTALAVASVVKAILWMFG